MITLIFCLQCNKTLHFNQRNEIATIIGKIVVIARVCWSFPFYRVCALDRSFYNQCSKYKASNWLQYRFVVCLTYNLKRKQREDGKVTVGPGWFLPYVFLHYPSTSLKKKRCFIDFLTRSKAGAYRGVFSLPLSHIAYFATMLYDHNEESFSHSDFFSRCFTLNFS